VSNDLRCLALDSVAINQPFYRSSRTNSAATPRWRSTTLAAIRWPTPGACCIAFRLFVLEGDSDPRTAPIPGSAIVYADRHGRPAIYLLLFVVGAWLA
jgi:hypothetical protein